MSRTFRRKNWESENNHSGKWKYSKTCGYYAQETFDVYAAHVPTDLQFYGEFWYNHADGPRVEYGPQRFWKRLTSKHRRREAKTQIARYLSNVEERWPFIAERKHYIHWSCWS